MTFLAAKAEAAQIQFAREEEMRFRIATKRDRMLGRWAGEMLGYSGEALEEYVDKIAHAALAMPNGGLLTIATDFRQSRMALASLALPTKAEEYFEAAAQTLKVA